ncbi:unnamed protein product [Allacma fusca]|uniref:Uncharacterized protein n=1 Tax=Allacma fusca TaxID=39272 RepID=A0A8J2LP14_9HEXA|nr:unnamed protein product [Allacma fusca]
MKLILALCLVVGFVIDEAYQCPPVGYSEDLDDRTIYYYCQMTRPPSTYIKYMFKCKTGLWDQALKRCNPLLTTLATTTDNSTSPSDGDVLDDIF